MKNAILIIVMSFFGVSTYAQNPGNDWLLSVGVNTVANFGTRNPFEDLNDNMNRFAFKHPVAISIEKRWTKHLYIEQDFSLNGFKENEFIDRGSPDKDLTYYATDTTLKYYFDDHLFSDTDWLNLYGGLGVGIFHLNEYNVSLNFALGTIVWVSDTVGIKLGTLGKFAIDHPERQYDNNHYQFFLEGVFKL